MNHESAPHRHAAVGAVYGLLNPIPFGCFVAASPHTLTMLYFDERKVAPPV